jgi:hypothetical protein
MLLKLPTTAIAILELFVYDMYEERRQQETSTEMPSPGTDADGKHDVLSAPSTVDLNKTMYVVNIDGKIAEMALGDTRRFEEHMSQSVWQFLAIELVEAQLV